MQRRSVTETPKGTLTRLDSWSSRKNAPVVASKPTRSDPAGPRAAQITQVVEYVLQLSGQEHDATLAAAGATVFTDNCAACHMEDGSGDRAQGAPKLTDAVWLYGGDREALTATVTNSRKGVMPAWGKTHDDARIWAMVAFLQKLPALDPTQYQILTARAEPMTGHAGHTEEGMAP